MFGNKLRSWMEAVRSRKKQHRKEKQSKIYSGVNPQKHCVKWDIGQHDDVVRDYKGNDKKDVLTNSMPGQNNPGSSEVSTSGHSRYSANNLSSPESAYSTGYSTDGTSPGAPPENLLNTSKHSENCPSRETMLNTIQNQNGKARTLDSSSNSMLANNKNVVPNYVSRTPVMKIREMENSRIPPPSSRIRDAVVAPVSPALGMTSPRQRNRIRTNPWVPSGTLSPSPVKQTTIPSKLIRDSPRLHKRLSPAINRQRSLSSSSCSSLSGASVQLEPPLLLSVSDEDCTLNEMMGKYDESYIYEKETDILSDSDPTDCETDIDTGQDGGDEDDPFEGELDFIDNCSHLEFDSRSEHNTGHCSYYNYDVQRKRSSRRRATRRSNKCSERKRRSCSNKKKYTKSEKHIAFADGSKSAGATPLSVRRANSRPVSKLALQECLRKRSNSIGFYRNQIDSIDKRDKEADLKYRELITEAEQILRAMKTNGLSPRRMPGPANKRVELLRSTECAKPEIFAKNRIQVAEDNSINASFCTKIPSNTSHNCPRFSPKKNHITKFIISNSPILVKKEWEMQNNLYLSPVSHRKTIDKSHQVDRSPRVKQNLETNRVSPKQRRKYSRSHIVDSSSDSDENTQKHVRKNKVCPQSEPVRRKVYFGHDTLIPNGPLKPAGFNKEKVPKGECSTNSTENLRQQVLLNTLVNLKKNLEDHSASLKQVYRSSQNIYV